MPAVLQRPSKEIAECYRRAGHALERANCAMDAASKQEFLDMERRWLSLARSYEFSLMLPDFAALQRRSARKRGARVARVSALEFGPPTMTGRERWPTSRFTCLCSPSRASASR
jgi:hypothetical protein